MLKTFLIYLLSFTSGSLGILYYLLKNKYNSQSTQLRMLAKQVNGYSSQINSLNKSENKITVYYNPIPFSNGETIRNCSLYISPLSSSSVLRTIQSGTKVDIIDSVEALETLWYEVKVIIQDDKNIKGFIRQEFIKGVTFIHTDAVRRGY